MDHVHIIIKGQPNTEMSKFINAYKSASSRLIKKEFPQIKQQLWKEMFWSKSYCLLTTGGVTVETIQRYIQSQGGDECDNAASNQISNISKQTTSETT